MGAPLPGRSLMAGPRATGCEHGFCYDADGQWDGCQELSGPDLDRYLNDVDGAMDAGTEDDPA